MADIKSMENSHFLSEEDLREEDLRQAIEMLFFAYRDFTGEPDSMLAEIGLGRAHHRAVYFVGRNAGIPVTELLAILKITKQSLSRVLSQLIAEGYIEQRTGVEDRRKRHLHLTAKGIELEHQLTANQRQRIAKAYKDAGPEAVRGFRHVLHGIMDSEDQWRFDVDGNVGSGGNGGGGPPATKATRR
ncbi:MAG: winged helix-turn-helix transcriptional regulator [Rhodospirillaceae bacterium]|jgi:DNA-binding MarR family transcriptional regulator|nr:winged helix-turn-helix transcriptional regulator [Rhodospirillaceae bacterium]